MHYGRAPNGQYGMSGDHEPGEGRQITLALSISDLLKLLTGVGAAVTALGGYLSSVMVSRADVDGLKRDVGEIRREIVDLRNGSARDMATIVERINQLPPRRRQPEGEQ